jgi:hypothetical protein
MEGQFKAVWDYIQLFFILYISLTAPFKVAFLYDYQYYWWDMVDHGVDVVLAIDMVVVFFTPYYQKYMLVTSYKKIAIRYLKLWFWLDLISIIPFQLFVNSESDNGQHSKLLKLPKLYRFARVFKVLKATRLGKKSGNIISRWITKL